MQISLDRPELEIFVKQQVQAGRYGSPQALVEAAVARLMLDPLDDELTSEDIAAIEESDREFEQGKGLDWKIASQELRAKYLKK
jgi:Arc/MetJ-type ribon-helix-helix transcriptional regulator